MISFINLFPVTVGKIRIFLSHNKRESHEFLYIYPAIFTVCVIEVNCSMSKFFVVIFTNGTQNKLHFVVTKDTSCHFG